MLDSDVLIDLARGASQAIDLIGS